MLLELLDWPVWSSCFGGTEQKTCPEKSAHLFDQYLFSFWVIRFAFWPSITGLTCSYTLISRNEATLAWMRLEIHWGLHSIQWGIEKQTASLKNHTSPWLNNGFQHCNCILVWWHRLKYNIENRETGGTSTYQLNIAGANGAWDDPLLQFASCEHMSKMLLLGIQMVRESALEWDALAPLLLMDAYLVHAATAFET